jgi:hypothetical protein
MKLKGVVLTMLSTLAVTGVSAQAAGAQSPNLSGIYQCVHRCAGERFWRIVARGGWLTITNEIGQTSAAWIDWPGHIWVPALNEGAVYSRDGFTIQFSHGSVWALVEPQPLPGSAGY